MLTTEDIDRVMHDDTAGEIHLFFDDDGEVLAVDMAVTECAAAQVAGFLRSLADEIEQLRVTH